MQWKFLKTEKNDLLEQLLAHRVEEEAIIQQFLHPSLSDLHNPFSMKGMKEAIERLKQAVDQKEKVLVYGDYDVDGTSSVSLFCAFMKQYTDGIEYYIPDRYKEGYGVSEQGIDYAIEKKIDLIITVDCGISAHENLTKAEQEGIDVLICDHHLPSEVLPPATVILNPKQKGCEYPFKELCACGVVFKLLQAWCIEQEYSLDLLYEYLDIVAAATCADMVPVLNENRIFVHYGLKQLNEKPSLGLRAMLDVAGALGDKIDSETISFGIAPRINAGGRLESASLVVDLLLSDTFIQAKGKARHLDKLNIQRKEIQQKMTQEALNMIDNDVNLQMASTTVLFAPHWHKGLVGIVASQCMEKYHRPTIILTQSKDELVGSARSVEGTNVYELMKECEEVLIQFGGHALAGGLKLKYDNFELFKEMFDAKAKKHLSEEVQEKELAIDAILPLQNINRQLLRIIEKLEPFGQKNSKPIFVSHNLYFSKLSVLKNKHIKLEVYDEQQNKASAIGFNMSHFVPYFRHGVSFSLAYTVEENSFKGKSQLQLFIKDIQFYKT
ncbi:MAG: single-stranded-DNA-specific exonuclease RecJ [Cytophagales bacterium]|nr:single-stranded-DNA-specific exonuclease RecJ [Cytophagales bacterium]